MIGDRPDTDGHFARTLGWRFGLVLTGVTGRRATCPSNPNPISSPSTSPPSSTSCSLLQAVDHPPSVAGMARPNPFRQYLDAGIAFTRADP